MSLLSFKEIVEVTSKENLYFDTQQHNNRDTSIYFKLPGHKSLITSIKYYYEHNTNNDYLITASNDHTIIIWNITNLSKYTSNPKMYLNCTDKNVKHLIGHKDKITSFDVYYDPLSTLHFVISCALNDKIKIWDVNTGEHMRELYDRTSSYKGTYESLIKCVHISNKNYLFTVSNDNVVKIWDFDAAKVLNAVKACDNNVNGSIIQIKYYTSYNAILLIDNKGTCGIWYIESDNDIKIINMKMNREGGMTRKGVEFFNDNQMIVYGNTGSMWLYDLEDTKFVDKRRVLDKGITWVQVVDTGDKKIIALHCEDQRLKLFSV